MKRRHCRHSAIPRVLKRGLAWMAVLIGGGWVTPCHGNTSPVAAPPILVTNVAGLAQAAGADQSVVISLRLDGTVWWADTRRGRLILDDDSGAERLELDVSAALPKAGARLRLAGDCSVVKTKDAVRLTDVPVVDNDGLHAAAERSGSVYLTAGRHPIRVGWFNRTDRFALSVDYEGPGLPRQRTPDAALSHWRVDLHGGATNMVGGLDFRCCEGMWWSLLPNFNHLPAVASGETANFDIGVRTRDEHVGVQFTGYLEAPGAGRYTFYT
jgi:hypothetical protein